MTTLEPGASEPGAIEIGAIEISAMVQAESSAAEALVADAGLPLDGIAELGETLVARAGSRIVGTIGLESFGTAGLLRSLAVAPELRGSGLGTRLSRALFRRAAELGRERLFLLTPDAAPFFARLGFVECERESAPGDLAASPQFGSAVCSTATCMTLELAGAVALQHRYPGNHCFGCGPANERGLQLASYRVGNACVARFTPSPEHNAGPKTWLNGGIVATLMDCHSIFAAIADAYEREGRPFAGAPLIWYVTGALSVRYLRPTPIENEVQLAADVVRTEGRKTFVECTLSSGGEVCAAAEVVAVRVSEGWKTESTSRAGR